MKLHCGVRCPTRSAFLVPSALGRSFGLSCTPFRWSRGQKRQWFNLRGIWSFFIHLEIYSDLIMLWGVEDVDHVLCGVWETLDVTHHNVTNPSSNFLLRSRRIEETLLLKVWLALIPPLNSDTDGWWFHMYLVQIFFPTWSIHHYFASFLSM